jgi:hypothetical protein
MTRLGFLIAAILSTLPAAGCGPGGKQAAKDPDHLPFMAGNPWYAYCENQAAADRNYKGKRVEVSGTVMEVKSTSDRPQTSILVLKMTPQIRDLTTETILITTPANEPVARLKPWDSRVKVRATVQRFEAPAKALYLTDGRIVEISDREGKPLWHAGQEP